MYRFNSVGIFEDDFYASMSDDSSKFLTENMNIGNRDEIIFQHTKTKHRLQMVLSRGKLLSYIGESNRCLEKGVKEQSHVTSAVYKLFFLTSGPVS